MILLRMIPTSTHTMEDIEEHFRRLFCNSGKVTKWYLQKRFHLQLLRQWVNKPLSSAKLLQDPFYRLPFACKLVGLKYFHICWIARLSANSGDLKQLTIPFFIEKFGGTHK